MTPCARIDTLSPSQRSSAMRAVKSAGTRPEMALRRALHAAGLRYRVDDRRLPGRPDLVFPRRRSVVFVHGCFWHGHDCPRGARAPKTNADYWRNKIARNRQRDAAAVYALGKLGWRVFIVWECALRERPALAQSLALQLFDPASAGAVFSASAIDGIGGASAAGRTPSGMKQA